MKKENIEDIEALLVQCEKDLQQLKTIHQCFQQIEANRKRLDQYYTRQYLQDFEAAKDIDNPYRALDEDSIWHVLGDQYRQKIKLLKAISKSI